MRALVIDDSRTIRTILAKLLVRLGFEVDEAENGRIGLEKLSLSDEWNIVLVDWNMPEMGGIEFVRSVRAARSGGSIPIVMITSETEGTRIAAALEAGVTEYIMKPFTSEVLLEKMRLLGFEV